ncbi:MAG: system Fe-S cluster assembly protein [Chromatiaceae bacterium]|nr:system Fe-S cluster assembly protein [Chromatiaceae bacterium]
MNRLARFAGFGRHEAEPGGEPHHDDVAVERMDPEELREPIIAALRTVHDPEIPINIYDLGLIYNIDIKANGDVAVDMTLTAPACPVGVGEITVELVWDPPWSQDHMSDEAKLQLGML